MRPSLPSASLILDALSERHFGTKAEGTGLEPATPCGASDFESDSSLFGYPPGSNVPVGLLRGKTAEIHEHELWASSLCATA